MFGFSITRKKKDEEEDGKKGGEKEVVRKKKKEPIKPWGKAERIIVFSLFGSTILLSSILALSARSWKLPGIPLRLLPDISLHKTYVLEKPTNENFSIPVNDFQDLVTDKTGVYSFFVARVYRDSSYGFKQYDEFESDSLTHLALLWQIFHMSSNDEISLSKDYIVKRADKVGNTSLKQYATGSSLSYRELAGMLCASPDAAVENIFIEALGTEVLQNSMQQSLSLSTNIENHRTTTADIGFMLKRIIESEKLSSDAKDDYMDCLRKADNEEFAGIFNDQFIYKYNIDTRQASVAGFVFAAKPFVLVVTGEGIDEKEAEDVLLKAVQIIADFES